VRRRHCTSSTTVIMVASCTVVVVAVASRAVIVVTASPTVTFATTAPLTVVVIVIIAGTLCRRRCCITQCCRHPRITSAAHHCRRVALRRVYASVHAAGLCAYGSGQQKGGKGNSPGENQFHTSTHACHGTLPVLRRHAAPLSSLFLICDSMPDATVQALTGDVGEPVCVGGG
jgi:hypothetical protein